MLEQRIREALTRPSITVHKSLGNHPLMPLKSASQKKQLGRGGAGAEPRRTSTSQQSADNFMADLNKKLGKVKTSEGKGKSGKKPPPPPGKPQHLRPEENQPL